MAHHRARERPRRRHGRVATGIRAQHCGASRPGIRRTHRADARQLLRRDAHCVAGHRPRVDQSIARHRGEPVRRAHVGVMKLVPAMRSVRTSAAPCGRLSRSRVTRFSAAGVIIDVGVVVNVRDIGDVRDPCVRYVHVVEVTAAHAVPRNVRLPVSQRAPAIAPAETAAETDADAPVAAPEPRDQRG